jgi:hypothetical protein
MIDDDKNDKEILDLNDTFKYSVGSTSSSSQSDSSNTHTSLDSSSSLSLLSPPIEHLINCDLLQYSDPPHSQTSYSYFSSKKPEISKKKGISSHSSAASLVQMTNDNDLVPHPSFPKSHSSSKTQISSKPSSPSSNVLQYTGISSSITNNDHSSSSEIPDFTQDCNNDNLYTSLSSPKSSYVDGDGCSSSSSMSFEASPKSNAHLPLPTSPSFASNISPSISSSLSPYSSCVQYSSIQSSSDSSSLALSLDTLVSRNPYNVPKFSSNIPPTQTSISSTLSSSSLSISIRSSPFS